MLSTAQCSTYSRPVADDEVMLADNEVDLSLVKDRPARLSG